MSNIEVTKREVVSSIIIVLLMVSIGYFISVAIHNSVSVNNEKYFKSVKIDNNEDLFDHAIATDIGDVLSYGKLKANQPVTDEMIDGEHFSIKKIEEHYVMKTRVVTYTDSNGKTRSRTETYWEWDEVKRWRFDADTFRYLGREFCTNKLNLYNHKYHSTAKKKGFSNVRWKFYTVEKEFNSSIFSTAKSGSMGKMELFIGQKIEQVIEKKESEADANVILFWVFWILFIGVIVVVFVALDNKYLNGK